MANPAVLLGLAAAAFFVFSRGKGDTASEGEAEGEGAGEGASEPEPEPEGTQFGQVQVVGCNEDLPYKVEILEWSDHGHDALDSEPSVPETRPGVLYPVRVGEIEVTPAELKNMIEFEWNIGPGGYANHRHTVALTGAQIGTLIRTGMLEGVKTDNGWYFEGDPGQTQTKKTLTHNHWVTLKCQRGTGTIPGGTK
jgi:hypothetical protein